MSRTTTGCFLRWKPSWQTCSQTAEFFPQSMTFLKPSADVENEAKKWLHLLRINKRRTKNGSRKWHQAFTGEQRKVYSIAFVFSLPRCSRIQYAKNCVKNVFIYFFLHLDLPRLYIATRRHPMLSWEPRTQLLCPPLFWPNASSKCFKVNVDFHKSKKFTNGWRPQSLLSWTDN